MTLVVAFVLQPFCLITSSRRNLEFLFRGVGIGEKPIDAFFKKEKSRADRRRDRYKIAVQEMTQAEHLKSHAENDSSQEDDE